MADIIGSDDSDGVEQARRLLDGVNIAGREIALSRQLPEESTLLFDTVSEGSTCANALLPVERLPREILLSIFTIVAENQPPHLPMTRCDLLWAECPLDQIEPNEVIDYEDETYLPPTLGWICLTHVSSSWRALCLSSPVLWAKSIGRLPRAIPEFLRRAGTTTPVQVFIRNTYPFTEPSAIFDAVPTERVQMFDCHFPHPSDAQITVDKLCVSDLASLEVLILQIEPRRIYDIPLVEAEGALTAPRLHMLMFAGLFLPFSAPDLTFLSIRFIYLSVIELASVCSACPQLRTLQLVSLRLNDADALRQSNFHITLAHLETFTADIRTSIRNFNALLEHMTIPSSVKLDLSPKRPYKDGNAEDTDYDYESLTVAVASLIWRHKPCTTIGIIDTSIEFSSFEGEEEVQRAEIGAIQFPFDVLQKFLPELKLRPFFKDITSLRISLEHDAQNMSTLLHLFNTLPNIFHLKIVNGLPYRYLQPPAISTRPLFRSLWSRSSGETPLRCLEEIHLDSKLDPTRVDLAKEVLEALTERAEMSVPRLRVLNLGCFEYPGEHEPIVAALEKLVDEIRWKG